MDSLSSDLHSKGIGAQWRNAEIITHEDKDLLWAIGVLGYGSLQRLQHMISFYIGMLRGVQEQKIINIRISTSPINKYILVLLLGLVKLLDFVKTTEPWYSY